MIRLLLALLLVCASASVSSACVFDNYPFLDCATGAPLNLPASHRARGSDANGNRLAYAGLVDSAAWSAGVPTGIAHAVIRMESNYNPRLRGAAGEWGIGQIFCQTARGVGFSGSCRDLAEPSTNLRYAMAYLRLALDKGGASCGGVSLYNLGVAARPRCTAYGRRVLAIARR